MSYVSEEARLAEAFQIVLVEDTPDDARMTLRALSKLNPVPTVKVVTDGEEALECLVHKLRAVPDLVLLDLKLPRVHGLEILRRMKLDADARGIPVIILTSSDDPSDVATARQLGAIEYIRKPMDPYEYVQAVCESAAKHLPSCACLL